MTDLMLLPGIIAPAEFRYAPLVEQLHGVRAVLKDLEVYATDVPPQGYAVATEVSGIEEAADSAGLERFHLYAHSGGAACALAFAATHPERVLSLAIDEPATDFTPDDHADAYWEEIAAAQALAEPESVAAFLRLQLAPDVPLPTQPEGPPPPWMSKRPAGIRAFADAIRRYHVDPASYAAFPAPVLFTYGSLSHPRWKSMRDRLGSLFRDFRAEQFEGLHHLNTSHQAEPARTATLLRALWKQAEAA